MKLVKGLLKVILFIVLAVVIWSVGSIIYYKGLNNDQVENHILDRKVDLSILGENEIKPKVSGELLFLLAGTDQNYGDSDGMTRSDTLMLIKLNSKSGDVDILSIPRDTRVPVNGRKDKINHASAYGGLELTMKTIRDWLDVDLDYYFNINFESVENIVNVIGGVEIEVPEVMADFVGVEPGVRRLDGAQALKYVRFRKGYTTGDIGRVEAQQKFMKALIAELKKTKNILKLPVIVSILEEQSSTNISYFNFISKALGIPNFLKGDMNTHMIPGEGGYIDGISYYLYYKNQTKELRDQLFEEYRLNQNNYLEE